MKPTLLAVRLLQESGEHESALLGIPLWVWQLVNLAAFLAVLFYFVARPLTQVFRNRQLQVEQRIKEARERRDEAARLEVQVRERLGRLEQELSEIRERGAGEGAAARAELIEKAERESERVRREAEQEIARSLAAAREKLRRVAAELTATTARDLLAREINDEDRRRMLDEGLQRLDSRA